MDALKNIQFALKAPKGQWNDFSSFHYRSCEDILEAVKPLLREQGCLLTISDDIKEIGGRIYVKATATISDGASSLSVSAYAREALTKRGMDDSQITGTASSYARKYALNGLFLIDDSKDADTMDNRSCGHQVEAQGNSGGTPVKMATEEQKKTLEKAAAYLAEIEPENSQKIIDSLKTWTETEAYVWISGIANAHPEFRL